MKSIDLALLRSFATVVEAGGFTLAEKRVHRTQSTISQQIKRLEDQLGTKLLIRSKGGVTPTEEGDRVLGYARRLLALEAEMAGQVGSKRRNETLRLGITDDFAQLYLPRLLEHVRQNLPETRLRVTCDLSVNLKRSLGLGEFDLALYKRTATAGPGKRIDREPIQWVASRSYKKNAEQPIPLVLFPKGCVYRLRALAQLDALDKPWSLAFESPSTVSVQAAVQAGLGIAVLTPSSTPKGCVVIEGLPRLGNVELVYEFGAEAPETARALLKDMLEIAAP